MGSYGAKVSIQLQHAGPEGNSKLTGYPLKAASAIAPSAGREIPEAMPTEEVYRLIECYGDAARRAQLAGIDMVEVHCAHGYLVSTFISARTNKRTDEFGGCFENRMRLPRLIIENIRKKTGGNMPILCRINARDEGDGGVDVHDAAAIAAYLYLQRLTRWGAEPPARAGELAQKAKFSPHTLTAEERDAVVRAARAAAEAVDKSLPWWKRFAFRYLLGLY